MISNNNNANENNIAIPWYKRTINANISEPVLQPSNIKFNIPFPPKPNEGGEGQEQEQEQEQEQTEEQTEEQAETEAKLGRESHPYPFPYPYPVPKRGKNPEEKPVGSGVPVYTAESFKQTALNLGESVWDLLSTQQKKDLLLSLAQGVNPLLNSNRLSKGIGFAIDYDYKHFNMGKYYSGLVAECGIVTATVIMVVVAIAIPGIPPF
jgi:hypothetical protein